ncbi:MAG: hypothetical protein QOI96_1987 [Verrucomicrobiota bacterium]|jgi:hypothetical protein
MRSLTFHSLRHSFNSEMASAGVGEKLPMKLTGHATREQNKKYTHHELEPLRAAINRMPSIGWPITQMSRVNAIRMSNVRRDPFFPSLQGSNPGGLPRVSPDGGDDNLARSNGGAVDFIKRSLASSGLPIADRASKSM